MLVCNSLESGPRQQLVCEMIYSFKEPREPQLGPLRSRQQETADMRVPHGSGRECKRCDWKRTYGRDALQPPLQEPASLQAPLTAGIRFTDERKMESSPQLQHLSETPFVHRRHVWGLVGSLGTWGDPLAVIRMNRSVHSVNPGKHSPGPWSSLTGVLLRWSMTRVCVETGFVL